MNKNKPQWSRYWIGQDSYDSFYQGKLDDVVRLIRLSNIRKGIANFVRVMTGEEIPVKFSSGQQSYFMDDGQRTIVISVDDEPNHFDSQVGIALHESSHVVRSGNLMQFMSYVRQNPGLVVPNSLVRKAISAGRNLPISSGIASQHLVWQDIHLILNFIEDRRIDLWAWKIAPGYRPYYKAMYDRYWLSDTISWKLRHPSSRIPTFENYSLHILNMFNEYADPTALPGLQKIWDIINLAQIERYNIDPLMDCTPETLYENFTDGRFPQIVHDAIAVVEIIYENVDRTKLSQGKGLALNDAAGAPTPNTYSELDPSKLENYDLPQQESNSESEDEDKDGTEGTGSEGDDSSDGDESETSKDAKMKEVDQKVANTPAQKAKEISELADKAVERQKNFLNGRVGHNRMSDEESRVMDQLDAAKAELREAGGEFSKEKCKVVVYKNINEKILKEGACNITYNHWTPELRAYPLSSTAVEDGMRIGAALAHRVRVLNDETTMTFSRQKQGRLDKRLIASLACDNENVFSTTQVVRLKPVMVDVSIDASGSMAGIKWQKALTLVTALAYMAHKLRNMRIRIHCRSSSRMGDQSAQVVIIYDSAVDKFEKVKRLFPYLYPAGGTPEGLCYEAIRKELLEDVKQTRRFFVNLSDGEPAFSWETNTYNYVNYSGEPAAQHTANQIREIRNIGVKVLSFFITDAYQNVALLQNDHKSLFHQMYGKDAAYINPDSVPEIARELTELFMEE